MQILVTFGRPSCELHNSVLMVLIETLQLNLGVVLTVKMARKFPEWVWALAAIGLALEGLSCFVIPFSGNYFILMLPICVICFGIALIDTALLPMLGYIVDKKYVAVYGSVYAIGEFM